MCTVGPVLESQHGYCTWELDPLYRDVLGPYNDWKIITLLWPYVKKTKTKSNNEGSPAETESVTSESDDHLPSEVRDMFEDLLLEQEQCISTVCH